MPFPAMGPAALKEFLAWERLSVLKMDCEGCEHQVAGDLPQRSRSKL